MLWYIVNLYKSLKQGSHRFAIIKIKVIQGFFQQKSRLFQGCFWNSASLNETMLSNETMLRGNVFDKSLSFDCILKNELLLFDCFWFKHVCEIQRDC